MTALKGFWQFLNTDVKDIPWGDVAEQGIAAIKTLPDAAKTLQDNAAKIQQLAPYAQKAEPLLKALDDPMLQLAMAGLPFVSIGINLLKLGLAMAKVDPTFESSVAIVAQLAYLQSLETVLGRLQDEDTKAKLAQLSFKAVIDRQLTRLEQTELSITQAKLITTKFRESELAEQFGKALTEQLQQVGLEDSATRRLVDQVLWGSHRYFHQAIAGAGGSVTPLAEFYRTGGQQAQERYASIDKYLKMKIEPLPLEQVFDESDLRLKDIYVRLAVQPLTQKGEVKEDAEPICSHEWTRQILEQPADEPRKVMFIEGDAGRGKSVFCRMVADYVRAEFGDAFIPLWIQLRRVRKLGDNLTQALEACPDLQNVQFVQEKSGWLADENTRFLIILDGFDELLLEGRATEGLKSFLQRLIDFQPDSEHQLLVTGRPLALQGIELIQDENFERVRLEPMGNELRKQWLTKWQAIFGDDAVNTLQQFLTACPKDITNTLAREPLLLYLLARLNREGHLTHEMFAYPSTGSNQEIQAKLRIYRESVNWVLEQQRQDKNPQLPGLRDPSALREVLQESALCVVQSGNEMARLEMVKQRFNDSSNNLLKQAQQATDQPEDKALNNLLTTFYFKPGERDPRGSVEFTHKSFGEYLFAERLIVAFKAWTEVDKCTQLNAWELNEQIYDVFGYGGLSQEIVAYLFELLEESDIDRLRLFKRLHTFYQRWCQNEFLDAPPNENLPQKKLWQLREQEIPTGLKQVDVFAGLNVMIILFKLHAAAQPIGYPDLPKDTPRPDIWFHPCGAPETQDFEKTRLLTIIHYADALGVATFVEIVGPHLSKANLSGANLSSVFLIGANLSSANLSNANLSRIDLQNADLCDVILSKAFLSSANFCGADLDSANLCDAYLDSANLCGVNLDSANLCGVNLNNANLCNANLCNVTLCDATLCNATLDFATLDFADLSNTNLSNADLSNATLCDAYLDSANLNRANLSTADLDSTSLNSALLVETSLSNTQNLTIEQMEGEHPPLLCNAALPPHLTLDPNRDWDRLAELLYERYPLLFKTLEAAAQWVEERRPH